jgi:hypothetical protein
MTREDVFPLPVLRPFDGDARDRANKRADDAETCDDVKHGEELAQLRHGRQITIANRRQRDDAEVGGI